MISLDHRLKEVAEWVERELPRLLDLMLTRWHEEVPEYFHPDDPEFLAVTDASIVTNLRAVASGLTSGRATPASLPTGAVEEALVAARANVAWSTVDRTYRIGHAILWEELLEEVETWDLESRERSDLLRVTSRFLFAYVDHVSSELGKVHEAERDRHVRVRERRQVAWVRDVLGGMPLSQGTGEYDLRGEHLALVAWGPAAQPAIVELGRQLDAATLTVPGHGESLWAWLGGRPALPDAWRKLARAAATSETHLALGRPASGVEGFRRSHRQASEAARVARLRPAALVYYDDVALEALLLRDERAARAFVEEEIGPLLTDDDRVRILLRTLRTYVDAGWVAASAAALLGVHERTIAYRLAAIEKLLSHPLTQRRQEVGAALRLASVVGGPL